MHRRTILVWALRAGGGVVAAVLGIPALVAAISPALKGRRGERWLRVASLDQLRVGETQQVNVDLPRDDQARSLRQRGVYVWRPRDDEVVVFSRNCTDLSCPVVWDRGSHCYFCPCHGGIFLEDGTPIAGPPQRPLYRYATRVEAGELQIDLNSVPPMA